MMSKQAEWARDLFEAAEELGYLVEEVRLGEVTLLPSHSHAGYDDAIIVRSIVLSGDHLRRVLRPLPERKP
jgi:hypothetical protein